MQAQGKHVILFIFGTALAAAVFAWTFQYLRGRRILELWGAENARLIRIEGDEIYLLTLQPEGGGPDGQMRKIDIERTTLSVVDAKPIAAAPGIVHARQALIEDASFLWDKPRGECQPDWAYALEFRSGERAATVLLDMHCQRARLWENGHEATIHPKIFAGWETFIQEHTAKKEPPAEEPTESAALP